MMTKKKNNTFSDEEIQALEKISGFTLMCESNIVSILWKNPELYYMYDTLKLNSFQNNAWKVYWKIGYDIVFKEKKPNLDEITVGLYLEKHPKLRDKYEEYGGFDKIIKAGGYVKESNLDGYLEELNKWNIVKDLIAKRFPVAHRLSDFADMKADEINDEYEALLNHVFLSVDGEDKTYKIDNGIHELIDKLNEGLAVGLPLYNSPMLTQEIGGNLEGNITLCGGLSGVGKTTFARDVVLPSIVKHNEIFVIMINEEGKSKWQRELLIWVANNIYHKDVQKYTLRNGKYTKEFLDFLHNKCAKWIEDHKDNIILKPFKKYTTKKAIKCIKKYSHMGVKYFMLDTFKADANGNVSDAQWLAMQQSMVDINDTIKEEACNVHIWITFQLSKSSSRQRYYTQDNIGMAKNIVDVVSTCLMIRNLLDDEFEVDREGQKGKNALKVFQLVGKSKKTKKPIRLDPYKHYQIIFIVKNREGASNEFQIVVEHDLSRNIYNEVGLCCVPMDT